MQELKIIIEKTWEMNGDCEDPFKEEEEKKIDSHVEDASSDEEEANK